MGRPSYGWFVVAASFVNLFIVYGIVFSIGLYFKPMMDEFNWSRTELSLGVSLFMLAFGFSQPVMGRLIDRYGPKTVLSLSIALMSLGVVLSGQIRTLPGYYLAFGLLAGLGYSGAGALANAVVVSRWFSEGRGLALGVSSAGTNLGQLVLFPVTMYLILFYGWRASFTVMGLLLLVLVLPLVLFLVKDRPPEEKVVGGLDPPDLLEERFTILEAARTRSFWLLFLGFFVCGFTAHGVFVHFPLYALEMGIGEMAVANLLGLIGGVSVFGVLVMGSVSDRVGRKVPLAATYALRSISFFWLLGARDTASLTVFVVLFGFSYFATVPLVSGCVADIYGRASMGSILGFIWFSHAMGQAVGPYLAGLAFDASHSYATAFQASAFLLLAAAVASLLVKERYRSP